MKISYVLATEKPKYCGDTVIKSILDLPVHNKEIIVVSSNTDFSHNKEVKFVYDMEQSGGVHAYNEAYEYATGDWIINVLDDSALPENFLDFLKDVETDEFKSLSLHVGNLIPMFWGPGYQTWHKEIKGYADEPKYPLNEAIPPNDPYPIPYQSLNVPIILREDVDKYLDGVCWNTSFKHHYCDHWLGVYAEYINGQMSHFPKSVWIRQIVEFDRMTAKRGADQQDIQTLNALRHKLYSEGCSYNYQVC